MIEKVYLNICYFICKFIMLESCSKIVIKFNCYKYLSFLFILFGLVLKVRLFLFSCIYNFLKENFRGRFLLYME